MAAHVKIRGGRARALKSSVRADVRPAAGPIQTPHPGAAVSPYSAAVNVVTRRWPPIVEFLIETPRLEFPVSCWKQSAHSISNRDTFGLFSAKLDALIRGFRMSGAVSAFGLKVAGFLIANTGLEFRITHCKERTESISNRERIAISQTKNSLSTPSASASPRLYIRHPRKSAAPNPPCECASVRERPSAPAESLLRWCYRSGRC